MYERNIVAVSEFITFDKVNSLYNHTTRLVMYIKISRLCMIILASIFIGMSIIFYVQYVTNNLSPLLPIICILCMLVLIVFILVVQRASNKAEQKKAAQEKEK